MCHCPLMFTVNLERVSKIRTVNPVISGHSIIDKTKILMANGSLMKVESIAECCNIFDLH